MSSVWRESRGRTIELKDDKPDTFEIYQHWLYSGTVSTRDDSGEPDDPEYLQLAEAYVLGDKLGDGDFKDVIIDAILHKSRLKVSGGAFFRRFSFPGAQIIQYIYDNTPKSSEARNLLVYFWAENGNGQWFNDETQELLPKEFLMDLAVELFERQARGTLATSMAESNTCKYHQHGPGPCYRDRFNHDPVVTTTQRPEFAFSH